MSAVVSQKLLGLNWRREVITSRGSFGHFVTKSHPQLASHLSVVWLEVVKNENWKRHRLREDEVTTSRMILVGNQMSTGDITKPDKHIYLLTHSTSWKMLQCSNVLRVSYCTKQNKLPSESILLPLRPPPSTIYCRQIPSAGHLKQLVPVVDIDKILLL